MKPLFNGANLAISLLLPLLSPQWWPFGSPGSVALKHRRLPSWEDGATGTTGTTGSAVRCQTSKKKPEKIEWEIIPIGSMYGIFTYIYPKNHPNVGK